MNSDEVFTCSNCDKKFPFSEQAYYKYYLCRTCFDFRVNSGRLKQCAHCLEYIDTKKGLSSDLCSDCLHDYSGLT